MLTSTALYKTHIHGPHRRDSRADVVDIDGVALASDVEIHSGDVTASITDRVTRSAVFTTGIDHYPTTADDPFSPYQAVVQLRSGVRYGDGTRELFPIFTGRIIDAERTADGEASFMAEDLSADVVAFRFEQPRVADQPTILAQIRALILEAVPQATFGTFDVDDAPMPELVWDEDRGQALDDLAAAVGGRWYTLGDGSFVVRRISYEPSTPVQDFIDGPAGLMESATTTVTRAGTANSVTIVSERTDGTDPVRVTVRDTSPGSPTFFGGKYGRVSQIVKVQTPLSTAEAQTLARAYLNASVALVEQWSSTVVPDHTMEVGDTARLRYRDLSAEQVLDQITYPLGTEQAMSLESRGTVTVTDA